MKTHNLPVFRARYGRHLARTVTVQRRTVLPRPRTVLAAMLLGIALALVLWTRAHGSAPAPVVRLCATPTPARPQFRTASLQLR